MMTRRVRRLLAGAPLLLVALTAAACGSTQGPQVASLPQTATTTDPGRATDHTGDTGPTDRAGAADPTDPAGASDPAGGATVPGSPSGQGPSDDSGPIAGRPQFRLDDTDARRTALVNAYSSCLIQHGAPKVDMSAREAAVPGGATGTPLIEVGDPVPPAAKAACLHLLPVMPPEMEASTNPDFHEQSLAYVGCLKDHGVWVELLNDHDLDWTYADGHPVPDDEATIEQACLLQAFGGH